MVSARRAGTACPRLEIKFLPVTVPEWEAVPRRPEPVSVSVHHRGEVEVAGNAEYKVLQVLDRPHLSSQNTPTTAPYAGPPLSTPKSPGAANRLACTLLP